jgi:hypothetical protein
MDGQMTPWDGRCYASLGEVTQGVVTTVNFPDHAFRSVGNIRAKTSDYILNHLDLLGDYGMPPPDANDQEAGVTTTRRLMYLPPKYVSLLLNPAGYTLRQAWQIIYPALVTNQDLITCAPLLNWLRVISMGTAVAGNANNIGPTATTIELQAPLADQALINHRQKLQKQVLPTLYQPAESLELAITQMAAAVTMNTNDGRLAREEKAARATAPKLPSDKFTVTLPILLDYLEIENEERLPALWHRWANCSKKQDLTVLTEQLHSYARSPESFTSVTPVVTVRLVQDLQNFIFVSDTLDDIKAGLQPFVIADGSAEHRHANLEVARLYGLLNAGDHSATLSDLEILKSKEIQSIPVTYFELERNLGMFGNLLGTVLGSPHPLTIAYRNFWTLLSQAFRLELQTIIDTKGFVKPAHVLRSIQLICYNWFSHRRARLPPPQADFVSIIQTITLHTYVLPNLPPVLYRLVYPRPTTYGSLPPLATLSTSSASSSSGSSTLSSVSGVTTPSGLMPTGTTTDSGTKRGTYVANLAQDAALAQLVTPGIKLKDLIGSDPPPTLDNGTPVCLSFLVRQGCWSSCKRAASHSKPLSAAERSRVTTYLTTQMQKLARGPPTVPGPPPHGG